MSNFNEQLSRMKALMTYGAVNEDAKPISSYNIEYKAKAADGKYYGIIRENSKFYVKVAAPGKETIAEAYDYIGGITNKANYEYNSYSNALKQFELKLGSINEAYDENRRVVTEALDPFKKEDLKIKGTKEMQNEIARQRQIMRNASVIMNEATEIGTTPFKSQPEAEHDNSGDKDYPFVKPGKAEGDRGAIKFGEGKPEKHSATFGDDAKDVEDYDLDGGKKPKVSGSVASESPKGGKVARVNESIGECGDGICEEDEDDFDFEGEESEVEEDPDFSGEDEYGDEEDFEGDDATTDENGLDLDDGEEFSDEEFGEDEDDEEFGDDEDYEDEGDEEFADADDYEDEDDEEFGDDEDYEDEGDEEFADANDYEDEDDPEIELDENVVKKFRKLVRESIDNITKDPSFRQAIDDVNAANGADIDADNEDAEEEVIELDESLARNIGNLVRESVEDFVTAGEESEVEEDPDFSDEDSDEGEYGYAEEPEEDAIIDIDENLVRNIGNLVRESFEDFVDTDDEGEDFEDEPEEDYEEDEDYESSYLKESKMNNIVDSVVGDILNEDELHVFGNHPGYRKKPFTLPETGSDDFQGNRDWNDDSVHSEEPFGNGKGDSTPFSELVSQITNSVMKQVNENKKKVN